jgi:hypothetical protein
MTKSKNQSGNPPRTQPPSESGDVDKIDPRILTIARTIGRQIAREHSAALDQKKRGAGT